MTFYQRWWPRCYAVVIGSIFAWVFRGLDLPALWDGLWIFVNMFALAYLLAWARDEGRRRREET